MPFVIFFLYMLAETMAFWAVAQLIGFGWAFVALLATIGLGLVITGVEFRRIGAAQAHLVEQLQAQQQAQQRGGDPDQSAMTQPPHPGGKRAGDIGLTIAGAALLTMPGFVSAAIGLLLIFPLTRAIIRGFLVGRLIRSVEKLGVRAFQASPSAKSHASYGTFASGASFASDEKSDTVIDEEELREWSQSMNPEDFVDSDSDSDGDSEVESDEGTDDNGAESSGDSGNSQSDR